MNILHKSIKVQNQLSIKMIFKIFISLSLWSLSLTSSFQEIILNNILENIQFYWLNDPVIAIILKYFIVITHLKTKG